MTVSRRYRQPAAEDPGAFSQPTVEEAIRDLEEVGITIVGDIDGGGLLATAYRGQPLDPPLPWPVDRSRFETTRDLRPDEPRDPLWSADPRLADYRLFLVNFEEVVAQRANAVLHRANSKQRPR